MDRQDGCHSGGNGCDLNIQLLWVVAVKVAALCFLIPCACRIARPALCGNGDLLLGDSDDTLVEQLLQVVVGHHAGGRCDDHLDFIRDHQHHGEGENAGR